LGGWTGLMVRWRDKVREDKVLDKVGREVIEEVEG
jgi:hypothetical protein